MSKSIIPITHVVDRMSVEAAFNTFLVIANGYYGKGQTLKEALKNIKKEGTKSTEKKIAYWGTDDLGISDGGYVSAKNMVRLGEV